jgi:hypothetical protein
VIRVWSVGMKLASLGASNGGVDERGVTQIVIKLTNPTASSGGSSQPSRIRGRGNAARTEGSKVSCDVAVWTHDDSRIMTSQSILVKQSGTEILPGSQFIFLWESRTGQCLLGISGAHSMQCPVLIPHPTDYSLVCSAGADGIAKVWDWETGRCVFTHENKVEFGPVAEGNERNKISGYLDGSFSPDGTGVVLTDDNGRITILDSMIPSGSAEVRECAPSMREQYFANDYYELFYDVNGYCIERGSEQPPHLAPRGVRANHSGVPAHDDVNEAFARLVGPMPLPESTCRWARELVRSQARRTGRGGSVSGVQATHVRRGVREFDPLTTIIIRGSDHVDIGTQGVSTARGRAQQRAESASNATAGGNSMNGSTARSLSSNFRWRDYEDLLQEQVNANDEDLVDSDDEEFEPTSASARTRSAVDDNSDDSEDLEHDEDEAESPQRRSRQGTRSTSNGRSVRAQRRSQRTDRNHDFVEIGSDEEDLQYMSTNNDPSGPYARDYIHAGHIWRLPSGSTVRRKWLRRYESDSSYSGRKIYTPQVGDSVVYIPRAHFETIKEFPSLTPPWQKWPQGAVWPVVLCCIRGIRYRFPYQDYFGARQ